MKEYQVKVPFSKKGVAIRIALTLALIVGINVWIKYNRNSNTEELDFSLGYLDYIPYIIMAIAVGVGFYIGYRRINKLMLFLQLHENAIHGKVEGHFDIVIQRDDIETITENENGDIVVKGKQAFAGLLIPHNIIGYEEIKETLAQWHPITASNITGPRKKDWQASMGLNVAAVINGIAFFINLLSKDYYTIIIASTITIITGVFAYYKSRAIEERITILKKAKWVYFYFAVLALGKLIMILVKPELFD